MKKTLLFLCCGAVAVSLTACKAVLPKYMTDAIENPYVDQPAPCHKQFAPESQPSWQQANYRAPEPRHPAYDHREDRPAYDARMAQFNYEAAEQSRIAREEEMARLAQEAEEARITHEEETARLKQEAKEAKIAAEAKRDAELQRAYQERRAYNAKLDRILLINLTTREMVSCSSDELNQTGIVSKEVERCAQNMEKQGYVRVTDVPRFTAPDDQFSRANYPSGRFRGVDPTPRW